MKCTKCGVENSEQFRFCGTCGTALQIPLPANPQPNDATNPTVKAGALNWGISEYAKLGYRVLFEDDTTAQLVKPKKVSLLGGALTRATFILATCGGLFDLRFGLVMASVFSFSLILTLLVYFLSKDQSLYLYVDQQGRLNSVKQ